MTLLITGGLGFLGRSLCRDLLAEGHDLTVVDDLSNPVVGPEAFAGEARVVVSTIEAHAAGAPAAAGAVEHVFHLASPVGPVAILEHAGRLAPRILAETAAALDVAVAARAGFTLVSSSEVYGSEGRQDEQRPCTIPLRNSVRLEYALGKRMAEAIVANRMESEGLPFTIVRPFNMAGPYQRERGGFVIPTFVRQALEGAPLTVFGDGTQRRAFGHVDEVARGVVLASRQGASGGLYNLGCPENSISIGELARLVVERTGSSSPVEHVDARALHGPRYVEAFDKQPDIARARGELGWSPERDLLSILDEVIAHRRARGRSGARTEP